MEGYHLPKEYVLISEVFEFTLKRTAIMKLYLKFKQLEKAGIYTDVKEFISDVSESVIP